MNEKRFSFFNIFLCCVFFGMFFFAKIDSFASSSVRIDLDINGFSYVTINGEQQSTLWSYNDEDLFPLGTRFCVVYDSSFNNGSTPYVLMSNINRSVVYTVYGNGNLFYQSQTFYPKSYQGFYRYSVSSTTNSSFFFTEVGRTSLNVFDSYDDALSYLSSGVVPERPYDDSLNLDDFRVWDYTVKDGLSDSDLHDYSNIFSVSWSDERISTVKVRIDSTDRTEDFISTLSPYTQAFQSRIFAHTNGDVITLTATPYKADGTYGNSLYCSFIFENNGLLKNIYRKFVNTPHQNNTIEIPYSGNDVSYEVDGVTTNNTYKVYYNPTTNEYGDLNLYEIYYSPVIIYDFGTPDEEIEETQSVVNNTYITNNYYDSTKTIDYNFDFNINDVSSGDIQQSYKEVGDFFTGLGSFISKLASVFGALFPFLPSFVSSAIVIAFGILVLVGIIVLFIKLIKFFLP